MIIRDSFWKVFTFNLWQATEEERGKAGRDGGNSVEEAVHMKCIRSHTHTHSLRCTHLCIYIFFLPDSFTSGLIPRIPSSFVSRVSPVLLCFQTEQCWVFSLFLLNMKTEGTESISIGVKIALVIISDDNITLRDWLFLAYLYIILAVCLLKELLIAVIVYSFYFSCEVQHSAFYNSTFTSNLA